MAIFESLFDVIYLSVVLGLGIRLLLEKNKGAKLFGIMAILLGAGDAFHLIPRVVSHLSPLGFEGHYFVLSWGQFVTSITMTIKKELWFTPNHLWKIYVHVLVLGFITMLLLYIVTNKMNDEQMNILKKSIHIFEAGLVFTVVNMFIIGIYEVVGMNNIKIAALNGLSGLGHIILAVGLVWYGQL